MPAFVPDERNQSLKADPNAAAIAVEVVIAERLHRDEELAINLPAASGRRRFLIGDVEAMNLRLQPVVNCALRPGKMPGHSTVHVVDHSKRLQQDQLVGVVLSGSLEIG